jgi:hypothetical protein
MPTPDPEVAARLRASFEGTAMASRGDLPGALITVFDSDLRLILAAGHVLGRREGSPIHHEGRPLAEAFPPELWRQIEPLCRSALRGDTRSRMIRSALRVSPRRAPRTPPRSPAASR